MPASAASASPGFLQRLPRGRWTVVGAAFLLGWLLFAVVWLASRDEQAGTAVPVQPVAAPETFEPLPRPMAAGDAATPLPAPDEEAPRPVEPEPAPVAAAPAPAEASPLPPSIEDTASVVGAAVQPPAPLAVRSPSPRYPVAAMRRGDTGTVVLAVAIDAAGQPVSVEIDRRSGSRDLDRAAVEAVSRWRFSPARDAAGNPVPGQLSVPIDFKME
jgi:protein TonB